MVKDKVYPKEKEGVKVKQSKRLQKILPKAGERSVNIHNTCNNNINAQYTKQRE